MHDGWHDVNVEMEIPRHDKNVISIVALVRDIMIIEENDDCSWMALHVLVVPQPPVAIATEGYVSPPSVLSSATSVHWGEDSVDQNPKLGAEEESYFKILKNFKVPLMEELLSDEALYKARLSHADLREMRYEDIDKMRQNLLKKRKALIVEEMRYEDIDKMRQNLLKKRKALIVEDATFDVWKVVRELMERSILPMELMKIDSMEFDDLQWIDINRSLSQKAESNAVEARAQVELAREKIDCLRESLDKALTNLAKKREVLQEATAKIEMVEQNVEDEIIETKLETEGRIVDARRMVVEAFKVLANFKKEKI
ncbi:hypothetical protein COCNU_14G010610 [Cocos nucifera]|uniref:Uncharacterized protein n=1 Tax=Cocos nucifera TaxID=13894 RepID=A0A8K0NCS2_COCNU|nr:hypothetical protein COCNU_14G010610 [Cocos nucifera]